MENDQLFTVVASIFVPFVVAAVLAICERIGFVWAKLNQPTIAAIVGGVLGGLYHYEPLYRALNDSEPGATLGSFILGGIMAGLAGSGLKSLAKDVSSGAFTATSQADVIKMRKGGGIGS